MKQNEGREVDRAISEPDILIVALSVQKECADTLAKMRWWRR